MTLAINELVFDYPSQLSITRKKGVLVFKALDFGSPVMKIATYDLSHLVVIKSESSDGGFAYDVVSRASAPAIGFVVARFRAMSDAVQVCNQIEYLARSTSLTGLLRTNIYPALHYLAYKSKIVALRIVIKVRTAFGVMFICFQGAVAANIGWQTVDAFDENLKVQVREHVKRWLGKGVPHNLTETLQPEKQHAQEPAYTIP